MDGGAGLIEIIRAFLFSGKRNIAFFRGSTILLTFAGQPATPTATERLSLQLRP